MVCCSVSVRSASAAIAAVVLAATLTIFAGAPAQAATPWGACGRSTAETKEVTRYRATPRIDYVLLCGNADYGYRHILSRHRADFERLALNTFQNWRDVADLSMETISRDPDQARPTEGGKACLSRVIFLHNIRNNQLVRQQIIRMIVRVSDNAIVTVFPHNRQC